MRIAIDGNLGSHLSYFLHKLQQDGYMVNRSLDDVNSPLTQKYLNQRQRYALSYHLQILNSLATPHPGQLILYERSPYSYQHIFEPYDHEQGFLDAEEHEVYLSYIERLGWQPDVIIYLYNDPRMIVNQDAKSADPELTGISPSELIYLHLKHEIAFDDHNCHVPIYKINAQEDQETIYRNLREILHQLQLGKIAI